MASPNEPLLSSPNAGKRVACKALWVTLSLAAVISLSAFLSLQFSAYQQPHPSDLCTGSPNPSSCHTIVSDALLTGRRPTPVSVFNSIVQKSLSALDSTVAAANNIHGKESAIADCLTLMDLSRDHLSANSINTNARTYMSAVLTNHVTCLDSLDGPARSSMEPHLNNLISLASASLAVLNSVSSSDEAALQPIMQFPSWLAHSDRKLLEKTFLTAMDANLVVAQDGSGNFTTVQEAVDSAPNKAKSRYVIYVKKGVYNETVRLGKNKKNIMVVGDGTTSTVITGNLNYEDVNSTFQSATMAAVGADFILQDLTIQNTAGAVRHQAVALRVGADRAVINRCNIEAYQDTLYPHSLRQFYRDCNISGTIDFIFGNAAVVFQNCNIIARKPLHGQQDVVTAQARTDPNQNTGTSIQNCRITGVDDLEPTLTYLGRPWRKYSRTVYIESYIGCHIDPKGWLEWPNEDYSSTLYYGEYLNFGPGAGTAGRVNWSGYHVITDAKTAQAFTVAELIQGGEWLGSTGVPFTEDMIFTKIWAHSSRGSMGDCMILSMYLRICC